MCIAEFNGERLHSVQTHGRYGSSTAGLSLLVFASDGNSAAESDDEPTVSRTSAALPLAAASAGSAHGRAMDGWPG